MSLGSKLLKLRTNLNHTQSEMARMLETTQGTYCDWESNTSKPNFENLLKICEVFEIDIYDLLKKKKKKQKQSRSFKIDDKMSPLNTKDISIFLKEILEVQKQILNKLE